MKKLYTALILFLSVSLGVLRYFDLSLYTDSQGFPTMYDATVRYIAILVVILLMCLYGVVCVEKNIVANGNRVMYGSSVFAGIVHLLCGVLSLFSTMTSSAATLDYILAGLMTACGLWLTITGMMAMQKNEPVGGYVVLPIICACYYFVLLITRFIADPAANSRISLTLSVLFPLAALIFFAAYIKQLYFRMRVYRKMLSTGLICFFICGCILPAEILHMINSTAFDLTVLLQNISMVSLGIFGLAVPLSINLKAEKSQQPIY